MYTDFVFFFPIWRYYDIVNSAHTATHCNTLQQTATRIFLSFDCDMRHEWALVLLMYVCVCVRLSFFFRSCSFDVVMILSRTRCHVSHSCVCVCPCVCVCLCRLIHSDGTWERTQRSKGVKTQAHTQTHTYTHTHAHIPTHTGVERGGSGECQKKIGVKKKFFIYFPSHSR